jgi:hypothetical protein
MATRPIFDCHGRPVEKTGELQMKGKHGPFVMVHLRFIDGKQPAVGKMTRGTFDRLKPIRGSQAQVWRRTEALVADGMEPARALTQATAELAKGVLAV